MKTLTFALAALALIAAPLAYAQQTPAPAMQAAAPLPPPMLDGPALLGPPPAPGSAQQAADTLSMHRQVSAERLALARADQVFSPWVAMRPVLGEQFTAERFPATARVLAAMVNQTNSVITAAKTAYARARPYASDPSALQCDPPAPGNGASPSYPSTHAAIGWGAALVLAELLPSRADALLQRGVDFGESRHICGFHYPTDIEAARLGAAAVVARLHAEPGFERDMAAARRELARAYSR